MAQFEIPESGTNLIIAKHWPTVVAIDPDPKATKITITESRPGLAPTAGFDRNHNLLVGDELAIVIKPQSTAPDSTTQILIPRDLASKVEVAPLIWNTSVDLQGENNARIVVGAMMVREGSTVTGNHISLAPNVTSRQLKQNASVDLKDVQPPVASEFDVEFEAGENARLRLHVSRRASINVVDHSASEIRINVPWISLSPSYEHSRREIRQNMAPNYEPPSIGF